jgi:hypothetical protein
MCSTRGFGGRRFVPRLFKRMFRSMATAFTAVGLILRSRSANASTTYSMQPEPAELFAHEEWSSYRSPRCEVHYVPGSRFSARAPRTALAPLVESPR